MSMADRNKSPQIPRGLLHDLIDTLAYFKLTEQTRGLLSHCDSHDSLIVVGSDLKLRLDLLALDEDLDLALLERDEDDPSRYFEQLLDRFDVLHRSLISTENPVAAAAVPWLTVRNAIVRQAALACIRTQQQDHASFQALDWSTVSTESYMETLDRLMPKSEVDISTLEEEEQVKAMTAAKQRRNLEDIHVHKRGGISSLKIRTLLTENDLNMFEKEMREVTRALDSALLPKPKIVLNYSAIVDVDVTEEELDGVADTQDFQLSRSMKEVSSPHRQAGKRKAYASRVAGGAPRAAQELSTANDALQRDLAARPGTIATALALGETLSDSAEYPRKRTSRAGEGEASDFTRERATPTSRQKSGASLTTRSSPGEQVNFDDSQSLDEPQDTRFTLRHRATPDKGSRLPSPNSAAVGTASTSRTRTPWTEDEVKHLHAAVAVFGKGKWAKALQHYKFKDCRTSVDLKDKWRNLTRDSA